MHKSFIEAVDFLPEPTQRQQIVTVAPTRLPGLYPWLRFGEFFTRDDWVESFGIDLARIDEKAANAYLVGEAAFFDTFADEYVPAIGQQRAIALRQAKLERIRGRFTHAATHLCGSPIERLMLAALVWVGYGCEKKLVDIWDSAADFGKPQTDIVIAPQFQIERHRVDLALFVNIVANEEIKIVVECDGHDFHEKTKEQAARDKGRERDLQLAGWKVLRFTGSEIWRDHKACARCVAKSVTNEIEAQLRRRGFMT
jgi:very-short-patch-repair endonuclease